MTDDADGGSCPSSSAAPDATPDPAAAAAFHRVAQAVHEGQRLQLCLEGRYVTVLRVRGQLSCIDSICFHAGGPLGIGDVEDVDGKPCLVCPWHQYKIDVHSGEKYYQAAAMQEGRLVPGKWCSSGVRQRVHCIEERPDGIFVRLAAEEGAVASDPYAHNQACGERILLAKGGAGSTNVGADGTVRKTSGAVLNHLARLAK